MDAFIDQVAAAVAAHTQLDEALVRDQLQVSKDPSRGDLALPCFKLAHALKRPGKQGAQDLARELAEALPGEVVTRAEAAGPFVNLHLDPAAVARDVLRAVHTDPNYGGSNEGHGKTVCIDFSSPNIAKPFHLGHLRSTVIGWSLRQIYRKLGYEVVGINHLGDWGTQFGFMMTAWSLHKDEAQERIAQGEREVEVFVDLYQRINAAAKQDATVRDQARAWFRKLEEGDPEAVELHAYFVERSKAEFDRIYAILGISHESEAGEAFYNDKMDATVEMLKRSGLLTEGKTYFETVSEQIERASSKLSKAQAEHTEKQAALAGLEGKKLAKAESKLRKLEKEIAGYEEELPRLRQALPAEDDGRRPLGVDLSDEGMGFAILIKADGGTTYTTRDLTAAYYRAKTYAPHKILYVVGETQRDHFIPWFKIVEKLGEDWAGGLEHVGFGNYLGMKTREGTAVFLDEVLERAREAAHEASGAATKQVELSEAEREQVARVIGTSAIKFFDLKADRTKNIEITKDGAVDWSRLLDLKGETGPYLQFAHARLAGILRKAEATPTAEVDFALFGEPETQALIRALGQFPATVRLAAERNEPSVISRYLIDLSQATHAFVHHHRVLNAEPSADQAGVSPEDLQAARLLLVACAKSVVSKALDLLGIEALETM